MLGGPCRPLDVAYGLPQNIRFVKRPALSALRKEYAMPFDLKKLVAERQGENYRLHSQHLNPTFVEVQKITGFDRIYTGAEALISTILPATLTLIS